MIYDIKQTPRNAQVMLLNNVKYFKTGNLTTFPKFCSGLLFFFFFAALIAIFGLVKRYTHFFDPLFLLLILQNLGFAV